jgi:phosphatidylserine decarboxylase
MGDLIVTAKSILARLSTQEDVNFVLTNRIPRRLVTQFVGWFSKRKQPLLRDLSIGLWQLFADVDLRDAAKDRFESLHDCFIRELKPGARPVDPDPRVMVSPCDAIVGACGAIDGTRLIQAKGQGYTLDEILVDPALAARYRDGRYVTLRLTSSMYHRFHAPADLRLEHVTYVAGDTFNTNPIALARVERLFCKNERAVLRTRIGGADAGGGSDAMLVTLVPVASILVASIRLHGLDVLLHLRHPGPNEIACDVRFARGQEMGWFELGSTILVFAPRACALADNVVPGSRLRMGQPLLRLP